MHMAMTPSESACASGLFLLGGLAVWYEYNSPAGILAAFVLLWLQWFYDETGDR